MLENLLYMLAFIIKWELCLNRLKKKIDIFIIIKILNLETNVKTFQSLNESLKQWIKNYLISEVLETCVRLLKNILLYWEKFYGLY